MELLQATLNLGTFILLMLAVLFAALMRAFSGFGFAMMAVPVFSLFLLPADAVVLAAILTLSVSAITYKAWWGQFNVRVFLPMLGGSVVGTAIGVLFLTTASTTEFQLWIGITVVVACVFVSRLKPGVGGEIRFLPSATGVASGLMNGAFAIPGPPVIAYAMICIPEPAKSRAFLMAFFFASNAIAFGMFLNAGVVTTTPLVLLLVAMPVMIMGDRLGAWLFHRVGGAAYRPVAFVVSMAIGVALIVKALWFSGAAL